MVKIQLILELLQRKVISAIDIIYELWKRVHKMYNDHVNQTKKLSVIKGERG